MDTAKDARILLVEDALNRMLAVVKQRRLKTYLDYAALAAALNDAHGALYEVKYSYADAEQVLNLPATTRVVAAAEAVAKAVGDAMNSGYKPGSTGEKLALAELNYGTRIITGFPRRLRNGSDDPGMATDIIAVETTQVSEVKGSENLLECRCTDGSRIWTVVTNIREVRPNMTLAAAVLPPAEFMGVISEAMFLSKNVLPEGTALGVIEQPTPDILKQARAQVLAIVKRLM